MATYTQLRGLFTDSNLVGKIEVAVVIAAETVRTELPATANHTNRLIWAKKAFADPQTVAAQMMKAVLAANKAAEVAQILGASDTAIQTQVNAAIDIFADGS